MRLRKVKQQSKTRNPGPGIQLPCYFFRLWFPLNTQDYPPNFQTLIHNPWAHPHLKLSPGLEVWELTHEAVCYPHQLCRAGDLNCDLVVRFLDLALGTVSPAALPGRSCELSLLCWESSKQPLGEQSRLDWQTPGFSHYPPIGVKGMAIGSGRGQLRYCQQEEPTKNSRVTQTGKPWLGKREQR